MLFQIIVLSIILNVHHINCGGYGSNNGGGGFNSGQQTKGGGNGGGNGGHGGQAIPAAIKSRHSIELRKVNTNSEPIKSPLIEVGAQPLPLTLHFRSASSNIKLLSSHEPGYGETQQTSSEDQPSKLYHEVNKPIIQEIREIITPYRRIIQEIRPVQEDIHTVIAKSTNQMGGNSIGNGGGYGNGGGGGAGGGSGGGSYGNEIMHMMTYGGSSDQSY